MIIAGLVLAGLAALLHVYIFYMESVAWTGPRTRKTFGTTVEQAEATRKLAFNQGFYNLFLAVVTVIGIVLLPVASGAGYALIFAGTGSMLAAALVLFASSSNKRRAALTQGTLPLLAILALIIGLVLS